MTLGDHVFVGRRSELAHMATLCDPEATRRLVSLSGPGGVGKTELVAAFERHAAARDVPVVVLDGADLPVSDTDVADAFANALADAAITPTTLAVFVLDRFERLAPLEMWFRERFLPSLPTPFRFVIAGRRPLDAAWTTHAAWRTLHVALTLDGLSVEDASEYLTRRGLPPERVAAIVHTTRGYPLALAMFADLILHDPDRPVSLDDNQDLLRTLLATTLDDVHDERERDALWTLAIARHTTEELLGAVVDEGAARDLHRFVERCSFVRRVRRGLAPHDLVRDLLAADLQANHPQRRKALTARIANAYRRHHGDLSRLSPDAFLDFAYLWRFDLPIARYVPDDLYVSGPRPSDEAELSALIERQHGPDNVRLFQFWLGRGAEVGIVRDKHETVRGMALYVRLGELAAEDIAIDPVLAALVAHLGEGARDVICIRWALDRLFGEAPSPTFLVLVPWEIERFVTRGGASAAIGAWLRPDLAILCLPPGMLALVPGLAPELDGRRYQFVGTVTRGRGLMQWLIDGLFAPLVAPTRAELDEQTFAAAVRQVLKDFHHPERLSTNLLADICPATDGGPGAAATTEGLARVTALREWVKRAVRALGTDADTGIDRQVLERTHLEDDVKQLSVAHDLGMPFGTYRRRLAGATERLIARMRADLQASDVQRPGS